MDSRKQAIPSTGSAQRGPWFVAIWKPVRMLSSKIRAEDVEGLDCSIGVAVPVEPAGVDVPFDMVESDVWKLESQIFFVGEIHFTKVEICGVY